MGFVDGGVQDPKLVCSFAALGEAERLGIERFFRVYARFKRMLNFVRGAGRPTQVVGWLDAA